jgi:hypothetical protein
MEMAISSWHGTGVLRAIESSKLLFIETKDIVETTLSLNNYKRACDLGRGALFLSVARGKVAEGIDFDRHYGRCVVIFGIPFQYTLSHVLRARLVYLRDAFAVREQDFLTFDAIRQTAQCVGRIIRSKRDYGIIVFADKRYAAHDKRSKLPQWVLQFMPDAHVNLDTNMAVHIARKFLKEMAQPLAEGAERGTAMLSAADLRALAPAGVGATADSDAGAVAAGAAAARPTSYGLHYSFGGTGAGPGAGPRASAGAAGGVSAAGAEGDADDDFAAAAAAAPPARRRRVGGLNGQLEDEDDYEASAYGGGGVDVAHSAADVATAAAMGMSVEAFVADRERQAEELVADLVARSKKSL